MKRTLLGLALLALLPLVGCKDPYGSALKVELTVATSINSAQNAVHTFEQQGLISPQEDANVQGYFKFVNDANGAAANCAAAAHAGGNKLGSYTACVQAFVSTINTPAELALIKVNNPAASAAVNALAQGFVTAATGIEAALGGA